MICDISCRMFLIPREFFMLQLRRKFNVKIMLIKCEHKNAENLMHFFYRRLKNHGNLHAADIILSNKF
jgi:hypothetical protein